MNPIEERVVWFVLGVIFGAIASWLVLGSRRDKARVIAPRVDPPTSVPTAVTTPPIEESALHHEVLASSRVIDVGAARAAGFNLKHADDLTVVEGIGPKIEEQLRANGIDSFVKVACLGVDDLFDILERGGPSFRFANPENWPQQASLAAQNRWKDLKQLQNEGIDRSEAGESL